MKIAIWQAQSSYCDYAANLARLAAALQQAKSQQAELLITPEMFMSGYVLQQHLLAMADSFPLTELLALARERQMAMIVTGPLAEAGQIFNASYFISAQGELQCVYRKTHLFGELDKRQFSPGNQPVCITRYKDLNIALLICYDVEFPETVRAAARAGAHLVAVATAQMKPFDFVNRHLIATRSWENQLYMAYVNQTGREQHLEYVGLSLVTSPDGEVLCQASESEEQLLYAEIDPSQVTEAQKQNPYLSDLRTDIL
ncbi:MULTISPECIES: nitrilase-related carbon-nitrogen hydrolase [unclassified Tatumella]|uniref:nitrilase-related carbon-nitrogen hydrolase n=1 Tax=unclassified Tatumella TaxID=2649542 RepID=UPI001BAF5D3E|nr:MULTISPECIES: nitrilase-related carbon-nitrogen hydrolase [unclassified Tatumella]MBS0856724.1 hypothetical protein [Tatumella sp. JGM16]MBS0913320.1 hypothetical protein [Tatumella sp. JGM91]